MEAITVIFMHTSFIVICVCEAGYSTRPSGVVVSMAAWMLDPVVCVGMTLGAPQVDLPALSDLKEAGHGGGGSHKLPAR